MKVYDWLIRNYFVNISANLTLQFQVVRCGTTQPRTRYGLCIKLASTMKFGQADTCLGNTLNNAWAHLFALTKKNICSIDILPHCDACFGWRQLYPHTRVVCIEG